MRYGGWLLSAALILCGCDGGGRALDAGVAPDAGASDAGPLRSDAGQLDPRLHFVDGEGREVTRLRYGEPFAVRLEGLPPGAEVTIESSIDGYQGEATFVVGASGLVDTSVDAPVRGTYEGVEPEGLLWSMRRVSAGPPDSLDIELAATFGEVRLQGTLQRAWLNEDLSSEEVGEGGIVARVFAPERAEGPLPGLLVVGGSEGGLDTAAFQAAWLAGYGYVAMALAYFDAPGLPAELAEISLEYFGTALETLAAREEVDPDRIAVVGTSRGGELALMLGERFPSVGAVVAQVPSGVRWGAVAAGDRAAWTYEGAPLADIPSGTAPPAGERLPGGGVGYRYTPTFESALESASAEEREAATIAVERTRGAVLLLAGADDGLWPSCRLAQLAMDRLTAAGHSSEHGDALHCFEDAGHFVPGPGWPTSELYAVDTGAVTLVLGGTARGNASAQRRGLEIVREFLREQLASP